MSTTVEPNQVINGRYTVRNLISESNSEYRWQAVDTLQANDIIVLQELVVGEATNLPAVLANFQGELNTLTSFAHQQVEQIRDFFHTGDRIFVVKSYITGETYKYLQRSTPAFSEPEIVALLNQVLPILSKLHQQPASHRNISPESIVRRTSDGLPVLTDFAVIKDIASQLYTEDRELRLLDRIRQLPIGFIAPGVGEDLYTLAVTAIMLLTGKSVDVLFNLQTRSWGWENWKIVSDKLASVLNKMLSMQPMERFSSADAALSVLNDTRSTIVQPIYQDRQAFYGSQPEDLPKQPQAPTPEQIIATAASAATATTIVAKAAASAAATATSVAAQKASASVSTNLKKVQLQDWHKAVLAGGGFGLILLVAGIWFIQSRSEPPAAIIPSVAVPSNSSVDTTPSPQPTSQPTSENITASPSPSSNSDPNQISPDISLINHYKLIQNKQLDESWNDLSPSFQGNDLAKGLKEYKEWWNSVDRVDIGAMEILEKSPNRAVVKANLSYQLRGGRTLADKKKYLYLIWENGKWMIDKKSEIYAPNG
jgi:serine/threonine protein kinase